QYAETHAERLDCVVVLVLDGAVPIAEIAAVLIEQYANLAQRNEQSRGLLVLCRQGVQLASHAVESGVVRRIRLSGERISMRRQSLQLVHERGAELRKGGLQIPGAPVDGVDGGCLLVQPHDVSSQIPDAETGRGDSAGAGRGGG